MSARMRSSWGRFKEVWIFLETTPLSSIIGTFNLQSQKSECFWCYKQRWLNAMSLAPVAFTLQNNFVALFVRGVTPNYWFKRLRSASGNKMIGKSPSKLTRRQIRATRKLAEAGEFWNGTTVCKKICCNIIMKCYEISSSYLGWMGWGGCGWLLHLKMPT